jgi:hypothetical protein
MSSDPVMLNGLRKLTGSGETAIRDPLYVFVVSDDLTATMTDEVIDLCV